MMKPGLTDALSMVFIGMFAEAAAYNAVGTSPSARINEVDTQKPEPDFGDVIQNVTVALGREAVLSCIVENLGDYKVGWMQADTQTILSLHKRIVTHNQRISVTHDEPRTWNLHIRTVKEADRGCYMCQINTAVMKKMLGCIDVHVPPNILDEQTSGDVTVPDGESVALVCTANGYPEPKILWKREDGEKIVIRTGRKERQKVETVEGPYLNLTRVNRRQMGAYVCIARNEVPPAVMKRIIVNVSFKPSVHVPNQLLGSPLGSDLELTCRVEAHPKPITFWRKDNEMMILNGTKYNVSEFTKSYHTNMTLLIRELEPADIGTYTCIARNSIAQAEGQIRTYEIKIKTIQETPPGPTTDRGPPGGDSFATSIDHSAKSSGLQKIKYDEGYMNRNSAVDMSSIPIGKGKRKDLHLYNQKSEQHRKKPGRGTDLNSSCSSLCSPSSSTVRAAIFVYLARHVAHLF